MSIGTFKASSHAPMNRAKMETSNDEWWRGAVIYQVYPRSFKDTNGDGIGDLKGCIEGLDHIASIGVDALWLSPFFKSPMCDFGYDVSDYNDVDPIFGTLADFDELVEKAHARDLKVIIDQVYSHSSDKHPWFLESKQDKTNPKANWYVWADPKPDGSPPNNWQSVFGGASWEWDNNRRQYYLHNFLSSQPDLNVHNPEVQEAILKVAKFWLDRGVDGFRIDAINFSMHDPELKDNPPAKVFSKPPTRPFDYQQHLYNQSHPDILPFLEKFRELTESYSGFFTVAEVGGDNSLSEMKEFTKADKRLNSAYSFDYLYAEKITPSLVKKTMNNWPGDEGEGWPSWAFSNHDAPRAQSRWAGESFSKDYAKLTLLLLLSLRGNVFIYQGEELGLPQADIPFEKLQDPEAIANWPETLGRDGARSPLPWVASAENAGFSSGEAWLPVDADHYKLAIDLQNQDETSTLNFARKIIQLRLNHASIRKGDVGFIEVTDSILAFTRTCENETVLCVFNLSDQEQKWSPDATKNWKLIASNHEVALKNDELLPTSLAPFSGYMAINS